MWHGFGIRRGLDRDGIPRCLAFVNNRRRRRWCGISVLRAQTGWPPVRRPLMSRISQPQLMQDHEQFSHSGISVAELGVLRVVGGLTRMIERSRRLQEKGADLHRLRQYVERWVIWLHGSLQGAVRDNRFSQIWTYVNEKLLHNP